MKTAAIYANNVATPLENAVCRIKSVRGISMHSVLLATTPEMTPSIEQLLTVDEQAVCDMATD